MKKIFIGESMPNFPQPPGRYNKDNNAFPNDLVQGTRRFYTNITFGQYDFSLAGGAGALSLGGSIKLPMPKRLNDVETIVWEEWSGMQEIGGAGAKIAMDTLGKIFGSSMVAGVQASAPLASIASGRALNPFQYMMFKRPGFKEHTLEWVLSPNTQSESDTLQRIIKQCKRAALPTKESTFLMKYPQIAMVSFVPNRYLYTLKPCAITSVQVNFSGPGGPSFFKSGAPTVVTLALNLKEIQLWESTDPDLM